MGVRFVVDENIGPDLVRALQLIGYDIEHINDKFDRGTSDEIVLEYIGTNRYALITKDKKIRKHPNEKALLLKYKIVAFFLGGKTMSIKETHKQIVLAWGKMESRAEQKLHQGVAASFLLHSKGGKVEEIV